MDSPDRVAAYAPRPIRNKTVAWPVVRPHWSSFWPIGRKPRG